MLLQEIIVRSVSLIDGELDIVRMELDYPERFRTQEHPPISNLLWNTKGAKVKILELAGGLFHLGELTTLDGTKLSFADIVRALELAFNIGLKSLYIQRHQSRSRKKATAPFLRRLVILVEQDADRIL